MKILDRHILRAFAINWVISFVVLVGMYVVLDMVLNFDDIVQVQGRIASGAPAETSGVAAALAIAARVAEFYAYQALLFFVFLAPIIPVAAAAFTMVRMSRFNELTAVMASGVPLQRLAFPVIIAATLMSGAVAVVQELVIPAVIPKLSRDHNDIGAESGGSFIVESMEDADGNIFRAARFNPGTTASPATLQELDLVLRDRNNDFRPIGHLRADRAVWEETEPPSPTTEPGTQQPVPAPRWRLVGGVLSMGLNPDEARREEVARQYIPGTAFTPETISLHNSRNYVDLLSTSRINRLLDERRTYGVLDLLRVKHFRAAQYINNILILLLAIPCVTTREPGKLKTGGLVLLVLCGAYLGAVFLMQQFAGRPPVAYPYPAQWPALLAAIPLLVFGPVGVFMYARMPT